MSFWKLQSISERSVLVWSEGAQVARSLKDIWIHPPRVLAFFAVRHSCKILNAFGITASRREAWVIVAGLFACRSRTVPSLPAPRCRCCSVGARSNASGTRSASWTQHPGTSLAGTPVPRQTPSHSATVTIKMAVYRRSISWISNLYLRIAHLHLQDVHRRCSQFLVLGVASLKPGYERMKHERLPARRRTPNACRKAANRHGDTSAGFNHRTSRSRLQCLKSAHIQSSGFLFYSTSVLLHVCRCVSFSSFRSSNLYGLFNS